jgi:hypothetical protein
MYGIYNIYIYIYIYVCMYVCMYILCNFNTALTPWIGIYEHSVFACFDQLLQIVVLIGPLQEE